MESSWVGWDFPVSQHGKFEYKGQKCRAHLAKCSWKKEHFQPLLGCTRVSASENEVLKQATSVTILALPQPGRYCALDLLALIMLEDLLLAFTVPPLLYVFIKFYILQKLLHICCLWGRIFLPVWSKGSFQPWTFRGNRS